MKLIHVANIVLSLVSPSAVMEGQASWFGYELKGRTMANGRAFDPRKKVCASWFYPLGSMLEVTNTANGKTVTVSVSDRGPAWRLVFGKNRIIDLSSGAFSEIADTRIGIINVKVRQLPEPARKVP
jgi:rare lipoprotein A